jgi:hypothetical protein
MIYKIGWITKEGNFTGVGPVLGKVKDRIFVPFRKPQAIARATYFHRHYTRARYYIIETKFYSYDIVLLKTVHPPFDEVLDLDKIESGPEAPVFYTHTGAKLENYTEVLKTLKAPFKLSEILEEEEDFDLENDTEEAEDEAFVKRLIDESLIPKFK